MRILHLITRMDRGGSAVNTLFSALAQVRAGHRVTLAFGPAHESNMSRTERECVEQDLEVFRQAGGATVCLSTLSRDIGITDLRAFRAIQSLLSGGFDIVHTHTSKAGALGRMAAAGRAKVVHTPHGHIFHGYFGALRNRLFILVERWLAGKTDALVALTKAERDEHLALGVGRPDQWHVIPSGVAVDEIRGRVSAWRRSHAGVREWDAVCVGRLVPVKGMERLIRAWAKVCMQRPEARLAIVGDGGERENLEAMCRGFRIERNVRFAGWCDPVPYLAASRCFALLSHNEGMGRAVVEAFAAGLPCVVSDVCGLAELVDDSVGACVDADDAGAVAGALLASRDRDVAISARRRAEAYSLTMMTARLEEVYGELVHG